MKSPHVLTRRDFLVRSAAALATSRLAFGAAGAAEPIIDIHQHTNYGGRRNAIFEQIAPARSDAELVAHQRAMGVTQTILLPAGRPVLRSGSNIPVENMNKAKFLKLVNAADEYFRGPMGKLISKNSELMNIRDEMLAELDQTKYLLTLN